MANALIGQPRVEAILGRALARERVSHAYLFIGPAGVGKRTAALLLAQAVNCAARPTTLAPCGACESCLRIAAGTHPDVHEIVPQSKGGQNISVEQMRDTRRDASLRPTMGRRKLYLLPNAEFMNLEASNTLLKTLEEPGEFVTLLLGAPAIESVLPTVQSRCQIVRFGLTGTAVLCRALEERFGLAAQNAEALARAAGGRVGVAFAWATDPDVLERRERLLALLREADTHRQAARAHPGRVVVALRLAEAFRELAPAEDASGPEASGVDGTGRRIKARGSVAARPSAAGTRNALAGMLDVALEHYREALLRAAGAPDLTPAVGTPDETDALLRAIDTILESQQFLERNVAPPLVLERMFARLIGKTGS
jgi:DNA polymerase-3 subunit delta'